MICAHQAAPKHTQYERGMALQGVRHKGARKLKPCASMMMSCLVDYSKEGAKQQAIKEQGFVPVPASSCRYYNCCGLQQGVVIIDQGQHEAARSTQNAAHDWQLTEQKH
eukprot:1159310-Pelagomonas_calceolata.AAC.2